MAFVSRPITRWGGRRFAISNVQILHQGGGTKEDAAFEPPEYEETYPEPTMFVAAPRPNGRGADGQWHAEVGRLPGAAPGAPRPQGLGAGGANGPAPPMRNMPSHGFYVRHVK